MKRALIFLLCAILLTGCAAPGTAEAVKTPETENTAAPAGAEKEPLPEPSQLLTQINELCRDYARSGELTRLQEADALLSESAAVLPLVTEEHWYALGEGGEAVTVSAEGVFDLSGLTGGRYGRVKAALGRSPRTLDPALVKGMAEETAARCCFAGLFRAEGTPALAKSMEVAEDGLTVTVTLREGLRWSDGAPLTAENFAYAWQRAAAMEDAPYRTLLSAIRGYPDALAVEAPDERTLRFALCEPCRDLPALLSHIVFSPLREDSTFYNAAGFAVCGPMFCRRWVPGTEMVLTKNERYYDAANVGAERIDLTLTPETGAELTALENGELAAVLSVDAELADGREGLSSYETGVYALSFVRDVLTEESESPAENPALRRAVFFAIDRGYMEESVVGAGKATDSLLGGTGCGRCESDFAAARAELALAEPCAALTLAVRDERLPLDLADSIAFDLDILGIELKILRVADGDSFENHAGEYDLLLTFCESTAGDPSARFALWR